MRRYLIVSTAFLLILPLFFHSPSVAQNDPRDTFFITDDGSYSVMLPDGWFADGDRDTGFAVLNFDSTTSTGGFDVPPSGAVIISVSSISHDDAIRLTGTSNPFPIDVVEAMSSSLVFAPEDAVTISDAREIVFLDRQIASSIVVDETRDSESLLAVYEVAPGWLNTVYIGGPIGMINDQGKHALEVVDSIRYSLPLDETYDIGSFVFQYPADWSTEEPLADFVVIANEQEAIDADEFSSGLHAMVVFDPEILDIPETTIEEVAEELGFLLRADTTVEIEVSVLTINDTEVAVVEISNFGFPENEGGAMVLETEHGLIGLIYVSLKGEAHLIWQTALNILLSVQ